MFVCTIERFMIHDNYNITNLTIKLNAKVLELDTKISDFGLLERSGNPARSAGRIE